MSGQVGRRLQLAAVCVLLTGYAGLCHYGNSRLGNYFPGLRRNFAWFNFLQDVSLLGMLAWTFARSLKPGRIPLCTRLADKVHGPLSPLEQAYTRNVTRAWAAFFLASLTLSIALFLLAPLSLWSFFANLCVLPLIGVMFVAEYLVRRWALPKGKRPGILDTLRIYLSSPQ